MKPKTHLPGLPTEWRRARKSPSRDTACLRRFSCLSGWPNRSRPHKKVVDGMRELRKRVKPGKMSVRDMVNEGRRY